MKKSLWILCTTASLCVALNVAGADTEALDGKAFEINGAFAAHLLSAKGGYPELESSREASTNRANRTKAVPLEMSFSNRISSAFAAWLVAPTTSPPAAVAVLRVSGGKGIDRLVLGTPDLVELEILNLGAQPQPVEFRVKVLSLNVSVLGGTSKASIPVGERDPYAVRLIVDGKSVLPLTVQGIGMARRALGATGSARERNVESCNDFAVTFHQADIGWLFDWYKAAVLTPGGGPTALRRVDVELVGTGKVKSAQLASMPGVVIKSFDPLSDPAGVAVTAGFNCAQFALLPDAFK